MTSQISCAYQVTAAGAFTPTELQASVAAVPIDNDLLLAYGLRVISDSTPAPVGNLVTRTIVLGMLPSVAATATANLYGGDPTGSPLTPVIGFTAGADYVVPPLVIADPPLPGNRQATMHATLGAVGIVVDAGGSLYTPATVIVFSGGNLAEGGTQAVAHAIIALGVITGVVVDVVGGPYTIPPIVTAVDSGGGSGAVLTVSLGLSGIVLDDPGLGYIPPPPNLTVVPQYKALFPDGTDQASPVVNWMTEVLQNELSVPVIALLPVVS
jgi:hypothetical protein